MIRTLTEVAVELPLSILGLVAIAHAQYDTQAECRQWGGYGVLGTGLATGLDQWNVTQDVTTLADGSRVDCVRLTKRPDFFGGEPKPPIDYLFPFDNLRAGVVAALTMAVEA